MAKDPLSQYEGYAEGANLATALGRSGAAEKLTTKMNRLLKKNEGLDVSGLDIESFDNWEDFGTGSADQGVKALTRLRKKGLSKRGVKDIGRATNRYQIGLNKSMEGLMKQGLQEEIDPSLEAAQERADQMAQEDAISAGEEAAMRSRIAAMVRQAEGSRLSRVGSALGIGNMENSPAAAALASRAAEDADRTLVSSLRDMGLQVDQMNRDEARKDIELATRIASQRFNILNGDASSLISMRGDIAEMIDALYSRDVAIDLQRQALDDASGSSLMEQIGGWANIGTGLLGAGIGAYESGIFGGGEE